MAVAGLSIRPYFDNHISPWVADDLRRRGFDAVHSLAIGNEDFTDEQDLRWATDHGHAIVSFDRRDFERLAVDWFLRGEHHAVIILSVAPPRLSIAAFHRRLLAFLDQVTADELLDQIRWLDDQWS